MNIEISFNKSDRLWYVVADTESGLCHDSFFTVDVALAFAKAFYGASVIKEVAA